MVATSTCMASRREIDRTFDDRYSPNFPGFRGRAHNEPQEKHFLDDETDGRSACVDGSGSVDPRLPSLCRRCGDLSSGRAEDPGSQLVSGKYGILRTTCGTHSVSEPDRGFGATYSSASAVGCIAVADR